MVGVEMIIPGCFLKDNIVLSLCWSRLWKTKGNQLNTNNEQENYPVAMMPAITREDWIPCSDIMPSSDSFDNWKFSFQ